MPKDIQEEVEALLHQLDQPEMQEAALPESGLVVGSAPKDEAGEQETPPGTDRVIHVYPVEGGGVYLTETPLPETGETAKTETVESVPTTTNVATSTRGEKALLCLSVFLLVAILSLDICASFYTLFFQSATITITARTKAIGITKTLQLVTGLPGTQSQLQARSLAQVSVSQQATGQASGTFHQQPTYAIGYLTFYNGLFRPQTVGKGAIFTGSDGQRVVIDQAGAIPAANPPSFGETNIQAHAINTGSSGNIRAGDINGPCCGTSILVRNTQNFTGGQDSKTFTIVTKDDITALETPLKDQISQSTQAALQAQQRQGESIVLNSCRPELSADHKAGDQATQVSVVATETCSGVAYSTDALHENVMNTLSDQAVTTLSNGYTLLGNITLSATQIVHVEANTLLTVSAKGLWGYFPSTRQQQTLKHLIAGKRTQAALHLLQAVPGIKSVSISGLSDNIVPTDTGRIHFLFIETPS